MALGLPTTLSRRRPEADVGREWEVPPTMSSFFYVRCGRPKSYLNESGVCELCEEYDRVLVGESLRELPVLCSHCGRTFTEKQFDRHRWTCYYRDPMLVVKGEHRRR